MGNATNHSTRSNPTPAGAGSIGERPAAMQAPRHASSEHGGPGRENPFCSDLLAVSQWMAEQGDGNAQAFRLNAPGRRPSAIAQAVNRLDALTFQDILDYADGSSRPDAAADADITAGADDTPANASGTPNRANAAGRITGANRTADAAGTNTADDATDGDPSNANDNACDGLTPIAPAPPSLAGSLAIMLFSFDEREYAIATQRLMAERPAILDEIGREFGITRERVRQIEKELRSEITALLDGEFHLSERLAAMVESEGPIVRYDTAVQVIPELEDVVEPEGLAVLPLIANLCSPAFGVSDGWLATPSIEDAVKLVKTDLPRAADEYGVVDLTPSASHANAEQGERETRNFADWLDYSGIMMYRDHAILGRNQGDRAAAVLSIEGQPLTTEEIADRIDVDNTRSLANRLAEDARIMRVDIGTWALREWDLEEYSGIRQEIRERIERNGGSVRLDALVEELSSQFSISPRSVVTYASTLPFASSHGVVTVAGEERRDVPDADPYDVARMFRIPGGWALRSTVNAEHARGSGSILPLAVAGILHMRFGDTVELDSTLGTQKVYWTGTNVYLGTIRRFVLEGMIQVGDDALLEFMDDGSFAVELVRPLNGNALHDALALAACPQATDARRALGYLQDAIDAHDCATSAELASRFADRGDADIAALLRRLA